MHKACEFKNKVVHLQKINNMTVEEILVINNVFGVIGTDIRFNLNLSRDCYIDTQHNIKRAMQEYARIKCKELLEIVAEKAKVGSDWKYKGGDSNILGNYTKTLVYKVNKNSILNAVDLEKFCS